MIVIEVVVGKSVAQLDGLAVRCPPISFRPGVFPFTERSGISQTLGRHEAIEGCEPVVVVVGAVIVGFTTVGRGLEFIGKSGRPFLPREMPLFGKMNGHRKGLRLPGLGKHGFTFIPGQSG